MTAIICKGSILNGTCCSRCSKCMEEAKDVVIGFRNAPLGKLEGHEMIYLSLALNVLIKNLGQRVLLDQWSTWVKGLA